MAKKQIKYEDTLTVEFNEKPLHGLDRLSSFSGIARSVVCYNTNGQFRNFKIVTLTIEDGIVVKEERSDPYANWETISRLELVNGNSVLNLNNAWEDGKTLSK